MKNHDDLKRDAVFNRVLTLTVNPSSSNEQVSDLHSIIEELQKNDIQMVFFVTPLSPEYTDMLTSDTKDNFKEILDTLKSKFHLKIYDFTHKYDKLTVWRDSTHVAENPEALIFSEDVLNMINMEIKK